MPERQIRVAPRPRPDGIDVDRMASVLLSVIEQLPAGKIRELSRGGQKLLAEAERQAGREKNKGSAA